MWFIIVEVEQETSATPPKKNPGSAPANVHANFCGTSWPRNKTESNNLYKQQLDFWLPITDSALCPFIFRLATAKFGVIAVRRHHRLLY